MIENEENKISRTSTIKEKYDVKNDKDSCEDENDPPMLLCEVKMEYDVENDEFVLPKNESVNEKSFLNYSSRTIDSGTYHDYKLNLEPPQATYFTDNGDDFQFTCKICGEIFQTRLERVTHFRLNHAANLRSDDEAKKYECDVCGRKYCYKGTLKDHRKSAHFHGKYDCKVCGHLFISQKNLVYHTARFHIGPIKTLICNFCKKEFLKKDKLKTHLRTHMDEKSYACSICNKLFANSYSLRQHLLLHTGAKPYVCNVCNRAFAQRPGLTMHLKSHSGQHPPLPPVYINDIIKNVLGQYEQ